MADIKKEINDFKNAIYGEEVRGSMVSLAEKLNREVEGNTIDAKEAAGNANRAAEGANAGAAAAVTAAGNANKAAEGARAGAAAAVVAAGDANKAAGSATQVANEVQRKLDAGELTGPQGVQGPQGPPGPQGSSGVMVCPSGMFSLYLDPKTGNLYAEYPDGEVPPRFEYDTKTGNLYYVTDDGEV